MNDSFILRDRIWREQNERVTLSSIATLAETTEGREDKEEKDPFRTDFERDRDGLYIQNHLEDLNIKLKYL